MACCSGEGAREFFTERVARRDARRYRKRGLDARARRVVDFLAFRGIEERRVLEVGGGTGTIQLELLKAGAARTVNVELSPAYEAEAGSLLAEAGLVGRVERILGDFVERAPDLEPAEAVVMHKVVCCYPDYRGLVGAAADRAGRHLVLTFPRDSWWVRLGIRAGNALEWARRQSFRAHVHPPAAILGTAKERGFRVVSTHRGAVWEFTALERA
jgi:cyclopropane fatty-acyl-phospholipid synthase-like methyltransferase